MISGRQPLYEALHYMQPRLWRRCNPAAESAARGQSVYDTSTCTGGLPDRQGLPEHLTNETANKCGGIYSRPYARPAAKSRAQYVGIPAVSR
jgi:hypothetical protein